MSLFKTISESVFLQDYWQKKALVSRQVFSNLDEIVDANELAGIACEEDVESRIISGKELKGKWDCQHGPFNEEVFSKLPKQNWTLLVQGLEQWDENARSLLERFSFLPKWRLDDLMASYAPKGGGVGPHFDYYDVFLIQVSGTREWKLGSLCDEKTTLQKNDEVKLLAEFNTQETHELKAGDMLYIPAGLSHWGTALTNDCITFSVGFRAPSEKEIAEDAVEDILSTLLEAKRYQDTEESIDTKPFKINAKALDNVQALLADMNPESISKAYNKAFGRLVTDSRYNPYDDNSTEFKAADLQVYSKEKPLELEDFAYTRMAYDENRIYINGEDYGAEESFSEMLANKLIDRELSISEAELLAKFLNMHFFQPLS